VHPATLTALGRYWRDVLSERTRRVQVRIAGDAVEVQNVGDRALAGLPLEIDFGGGRRCLRSDRRAGAGDRARRGGSRRVNVQACIPSTRAGLGRVRLRRAEATVFHLRAGSASSSARRARPAIT
jgi:hypothetical protein